MTAETARTIAGMLAPKLGVEPAQLEETLAENPLAAVALAMMDGGQEQTCDPAALVRLVATLVGGCAVCLGELETCRECGGKGGPGFHRPDAVALVAWISPALQRLGLCVGRPRRDLAGHNHGGGYG